MPTRKVTWRLGLNTDIPVELFATKQELLHYAIFFCREKASDVVIPAHWESVIDGNIIIVTRESESPIDIEEEGTFIEE